MTETCKKKRYTLRNIETGEIVLKEVEAYDVQCFFGRKLNMNALCDRKKLFKIYHLEAVEVEVPKKVKTKDEELMQHYSWWAREWTRTTKQLKTIKWVKKEDPDAWNAKHLVI